MTQKSAEDFVRDLVNDPELAPALAEALGERTGEEAYAAVARFAQARGYELDAEQAKAIRQAALQGEGADGELDDAALEGVAGGIFLMNLDPNVNNFKQPEGFYFTGW